MIVTPKDSLQPKIDPAHIRETDSYVALKSLGTADIKSILVINNLNNFHKLFEPGEGDPGHPLTHLIDISPSYSGAC